jgi:hypothetical protein
VIVNNLANLKIVSIVGHPSFAVSVSTRAHSWVQLEAGETFQLTRTDATISGARGSRDVRR